MYTVIVPVISMPDEVTYEGFWSTFSQFCEKYSIDDSSAIDLRRAARILGPIAEENLVALAKLKAPTAFLLPDVTWYQSKLVRIAEAIGLLVQLQILTAGRDLRRKYTFDYCLQELSHKRTFLRADLNGSSVMVVA